MFYFILTDNKHVINNYSWTMLEGGLSKKSHCKAVLDGWSEELVEAIVVNVAFETCALITSKIAKACCDSWRSNIGERFFAAFKDVFAKGRNPQVNAEEKTWKLFVEATETLVKVQKNWYRATATSLLIYRGPVEQHCLMGIRIEILFVVVTDDWLVC